jgi:hypothetical protein
MGSKLIFLLGLIVSAAYLYFCINNHATTTNTTVASAPAVVSEVKEEVVSPEPVVAAATTITPVIEEEKKEKVVEVKNATERISTPAFGFMASPSKYQIVALLSDNDEGGKLAKQIDELCKKTECSKDIRFEKDIKDASWQEGVGKIVTLLADGKSIDGGSLFIESNVLKLEGKVTSQQAQDDLTSILDSLKSDTFKVENHFKLSPEATKKEEPKEEEAKVVKEPTPAPTPVKKEEVKPVVVTKPVSTPKPQVIQPVEAEVIVAEPVMETTLDAEARVRAILDDIKNNAPETGIVAQPHMETTVE